MKSLLCFLVACTPFAMGCAISAEPVSSDAASLSARWAHVALPRSSPYGANISAPTAPPPPAVHHACPASGVCRIMPMGDSITDGGTSGAVGYRPPLWHLLELDGRPFTFVGSLAAGPDLVDGAPWSRSHEGHSGWSIDAVGTIQTGLQVIAADRVTAYQPDVVLLMIGTNDVQLGLDDGAPARLARLLDTIAQAKPGVTIVLSMILPTQDSAQNARVDAYNAVIPGIVEAQRGAGHNVEFVDQHAAFVANPGYSSEWLADRLHPTDAGYGVLAAGWSGVLRRVW